MLIMLQEEEEQASERDEESESEGESEGGQEEEVKEWTHYYPQSQAIPAFCI